MALMPGGGFSPLRGQLPPHSNPLNVFNPHMPTGGALPPQAIGAVETLARAAAGRGVPEGNHSNFEHMLNQGLPAQAEVYPQLHSLLRGLAHAAVNHRRRPNHDFASGI